MGREGERRGWRERGGGGEEGSLTSQPGTQKSPPGRGPLLPPFPTRRKDPPLSSLLSLPTWQSDPLDQTPSPLLSAKATEKPSRHPRTRQLDPSSSFLSPSSTHPPKCPLSFPPQSGGQERSQGRACPLVFCLFFLQGHRCSQILSGETIRRCIFRATYVT